MRPSYDIVADEIDRMQRRLGWREAIKRLDYIRRLELGLAVQLLPLLPGTKVLDVASGKSPWPFYLALIRNCQVTSFDLSDSVYWQHSVWRRLSASNRKLVVSRQDACHLAFRDESFDIVTAVSSIEHIEGDGDGQAMREMARVLKVGGLLYVTVPYDPRGSRDCYWKSSIYGREYKGVPVFWKRNYDDLTLADRILRPAEEEGLRLREQLYFGEPGFNFFNVVYANPRLPMWVKVFIFQLVPLASRRFLRLVQQDELRRVRYPRHEGTANGVILLWSKP